MMTKKLYQICRAVLVMILVSQSFVRVAAQPVKPLMPQAPGVVSYTYRKYFEKDASAALDTIWALGIRDIEFSNLFGQSAAELRSLLDKKGLRCSSYGVSYDDLVHHTEQVARDARTLGASYVRIAWIPHHGEFSLADAQKAVVDFNKAGRILRRRFHLGFLYHNHGYEFEPYQNGTLYDYLVDKTDPKDVNFELDMLWAFFPGQDPANLILKYRSRYKAMHLKDLRKGITGNLSGAGDANNDVALGTGQIDIPAILRAAHMSGIRHFYIEDESDHIVVQVPQSINYLKTL